MAQNLRDRFRLVKIEEAAEVRAGMFQIIKDAWWPVTPNNEILFFKKNRTNTPQCNQNKAVAESSRDRLYPDLKVIQIPVVYVPISPQDFV